MPTPLFIQELRALIGNRQLWLSVAIAAVVDDDDRILLGFRADTKTWELPGGIIEPGEEPADAAARECFEETGVAILPESLTSITVSPAITYENGDQVQYLELTFHCRPIGGNARVNDEESLDVAWFPFAELPQLDPRTHKLVDCATSGKNGVEFSFSKQDAADKQGRGKRHEATGH